MNEPYRIVDLTEIKEAADDIGNIWEQFRAANDLRIGRNEDTVSRLHERLDNFETAMNSELRYSRQRLRPQGLWPRGQGVFRLFALWHSGRAERQRQRVDSLQNRELPSQTKVLCHQAATPAANFGPVRTALTSALRSGKILPPSLDADPRCNKHLQQSGRPEMPIAWLYAQQSRAMSFC